MSKETGEMLVTATVSAILHSMYRDDYIKLALALICSEFSMCDRCRINASECPQRELADEFKDLLSALEVRMTMERVRKVDPTNERAN